MVSSRYGWAVGRVVRVTDLQLEIELVKGERVLTKQSVNLPSLRVGDEVVVSWLAIGSSPRKFRGVRYVDADAVEPVGKWRRESAYQRRFRIEEDSIGTIAERAVLKAVSSVGVRVEKATDYEDEVLGVDLWTFLKLDAGWTWLPIDVTVQRDKDIFDAESKYQKAFERGVLIVLIDPEAVLFRDASPKKILAALRASIKVGLEQFATCGKNLLKRREAMEKELAEYPKGKSQLQVGLERARLA